jgi:hypothetical protein
VWHPVPQRLPPPAEAAVATLGGADGRPLVAVRGVGSRRRSGGPGSGGREKEAGRGGERRRWRSPWEEESGVHVIC